MGTCFNMKSMDCPDPKRIQLVSMSPLQSAGRYTTYRWCQWWPAAKALFLLEHELGTMAMTMILYHEKHPNVARLTTATICPVLVQKSLFQQMNMMRFKFSIVICKLQVGNLMLTQLHSQDLQLIAANRGLEMMNCWDLAMYLFNANHAAST